MCIIKTILINFHDLSGISVKEFLIFTDD